MTSHNYVIRSILGYKSSQKNKNLSNLSLEHDFAEPKQPRTMVLQIFSQMFLQIFASQKTDLPFWHAMSTKFFFI